MGDGAAASWLSKFLHVACRLVRIGREFERPVLDPRAESIDRVSFADGHPFLLVSEASLADLNDRLSRQGEDALPMNRFRPNFVISGCAAFPYREIIPRRSEIIRYGHIKRRLERFESLTDEERKRTLDLADDLLKK